MEAVELGAGGASGAVVTQITHVDFFSFPFPFFFFVFFFWRCIAR
jgi:hypothetical protein